MKDGDGNYFENTPKQTNRDELMSFDLSLHPWIKMFNTWYTCHNQNRWKGKCKKLVLIISCWSYYLSSCIDKTYNLFIRTNHNMFTRSSFTFGTLRTTGDVGDHTCKHYIVVLTFISSVFFVTHQGKQKLNPTTHVLLEQMLKNPA